MGLDQFAYAKKGDDKIDLMDWRKHANLQGFMEQLWEDKDRPVPDGAEIDDSPMGSFNCIPLSLTMSDIEELEDCVLGNKLPHTTGFFFGSSREDDKEDDMRFIELAKKYLLDGYEVYYDSWW